MAQIYLILKQKKNTTKRLYIVNKNPSELVNKLQNIIPKAVDTIFFYFLIFKESLITIFLLSLIFLTDTTIFLFLFFS